MVSAEEFLWREWVLGEGRYEGKGARSRPRPDVRARIPRAWWQRLEEFLARRYDRREMGRATGNSPGPLKPAFRGALSAHFRVSEFDCHDGRKVPAVAIPALKLLAFLLLEPMRAEFGACTVLSGYRPEDYNRRIGGARASQHIYELTPESVAADLVFAHGTPRDWYRKADELGAGGLGLYPSFVHVDNRPGRARW